MAESIFIETTIPSYYVARPSRDVVHAARQQLTIAWWTHKRKEFDLYSSELVLTELSRGDQEMAQKRLELLEEARLLDLNDSVNAIAKALVKGGIIPVKAAEDAVHISCAAVHGMDYLLTWNCRHIANPQIRRRIRKCLNECGFEMPIICTPEEFEL